MGTDESTGPVLSLREVVKSRVNSVNALHERKERGEQVQVGCPTGFREFDREFGGLPKTVVVVGADTGVGKSALARAFATGAVRSGAGVAYIANLEDGNENFADRVIGERTGLGASRVRRLDYAPKDRQRLQAVIDDDLLDKVFVDDSAYDADTIYRRATALAGKTKLGLTVVDYLQLVRVKGATSNTDRIMQAMLTMQALAKDTGAPVLGLSQVTRKALMHRGSDYYHKARAAGEQGEALYEGYVPMGGDFHWASELEQFAKLVLVAFRSGPYRVMHDDGMDDDKTMLVRAIKNNFGPVRQFKFGWHGKLAQVYDLTN